MRTDTMRGGARAADQDVGAREACTLAMTLLGGHVPLTLIMDLSMPYGPHSRELLDTEPEPPR
jgi:hypothetical protein